MTECTHIYTVSAGTGLAGISAALLGAREVMLTDLAYTLDNLRQNVDSALGQGLGDQSNVDSALPQPSSSSPPGTTGAASASAVVSVACLDWADPTTYRYPTRAPSAQPQIQAQTTQSPPPQNQQQQPPSPPPHQQPPPAPNEHQDDDSNQWDMIIGADVVWLEELIPLLVQVSSLIIIRSYYLQTPHTTLLMYPQHPSTPPLTTISFSLYHPFSSPPLVKQALVALAGPRTLLLLSHQKRSERSDAMLFELLNQHFSMELVPKYDISSQHPISTHPLKVLSQHTLFTYPLNTPSSPTLSTHPLNIHSQHTLATHPLDTHSQHTLSINTPT